MACPTGRCALRRFDGHGTGSYRPTNSALAAEGEARLAALLAERREMPAFGASAGFCQKPEPLALLCQPLASPAAQSQKPAPTPWRTPRASDFTSSPK